MRPVHRKLTHDTRMNLLRNHSRIKTNRSIPLGHVSQTNRSPNPIRTLPTNMHNNITITIRSTNLALLSTVINHRRHDRNLKHQRTLNRAHRAIKSMSQIHMQLNHSNTRQQLCTKSSNARNRRLTHSNRTPTITITNRSKGNRTKALPTHSGQARTPPTASKVVYAAIPRIVNITEPSEAQSSSSPACALAGHQVTPISSQVQHETTNTSQPVTSEASSEITNSNEIAYDHSQPPTSSADTHKDVAIATAAKPSRLNSNASQRRIQRPISRLNRNLPAIRAHMRTTISNTRNSNNIITMQHRVHNITRRQCMNVQQRPVPGPAPKITHVIQSPCLRLPTKQRRNLTVSQSSPSNPTTNKVHRSRRSRINKRALNSQQPKIPAVNKPRGPTVILSMRPKTVIHIGHGPIRTLSMNQVLLKQRIRTSTLVNKTPLQ